MICLYQIDSIVNGTLYSYGLQFSYNWAGPYWRLTQIGFTIGWLNIIIAFAVQLNNIRMKNKAEQPATAIEKAWETAKTPETEKTPEESAKEHKETEPTKPPEETPKTAPEPEAQEKKEEPQQPEKTPEKEPQPPENDPDEIPALSSLFQALPRAHTQSGQ
jgi:outer membrane biosynthesis protein TonB